MELRTEITIAQADALGEFPGFNSRVGKLTNGNYSMSKLTYDKFKDTPQFQAVDFSGNVWLPDSDFFFYIPSLSN